MKHPENRSSFSRALEQMLIRANIKNATLAECLNYDISYISKWVTGTALPSRKNIERVVEAVADLGCTQTPAPVRDAMKREAGAATDGALREYITDTLRDAYYETIGQVGESRYLHNASLWVNPQGQIPLLQELADRTEPDIPRQIAVMADLFSLERSARLAMAGIRDRHFRLVRPRPDLDVTYLIDLDRLDGSAVYDMILLIHMMTGFSMTNFRLYHNPGAAGKLMIAAKEEFAGITVLDGAGQALCTTCTREKNRAAELWETLQAQAEPDRLIFLPTDMPGMLMSLEYFRNLMSQDLRWVVGHVTEHFVPEELFPQLLESCFAGHPAAREAERAYQLSRGVLHRSRVRMLIYRLALADFLISGELDFFNNRVILDPEQRCAVLRHIRHLTGEMQPGNVRLVREGFSEDFKYITNPCLFLSESASCLRLENGCYSNNLLLVKEDAAREKFDAFFEEIWYNRSDAVITEHRMILEKLDSLLETADMLY